MKQIRIVYNTGEVDESGRPVLRRGTFAVEDSVTLFRLNRLPT